MDQSKKGELTQLASKIATTELLLKDTISELEDLGLRLFSQSGTDRVAFVYQEDSLNPTIIKIALRESSIDENYDEAAAWNTYKDESLLVPVTDHGPHHAWIEMPQCEPSSKSVAEIRDMVREKGYQIPDLNNMSYGKYNGSVKIYDYSGIYKV